MSVAGVTWRAQCLHPGATKKSSPLTIRHGFAPFCLHVARAMKTGLGMFTLGFLHLPFKARRACLKVRGAKMMIPSSSEELSLARTLADVDIW